MTRSRQTIEKLRAALAASPENVVLREHLAETLLQYGFPEEAETEYRAVLKADPESVPSKIGLAKAFYQQAKSGQALVILEDLVRLPGVPAEAHLVYARALWSTGAFKEARAHYGQAIELDASLADPDLDEQFGGSPADTQSGSDAGRIRVATNPSEEPPPPEIEDPAVTFRNVGGMDSVKEAIRTKIIYPVQHQELYEAYGKKIGGGILLYGPPGCGKTHLARATAGEAKASFISVGIHEVLEMWLGASERNLHAIFESARAHAPSVLFFDEVDALGASRNDLRQSAGRNVINQFLAELDGFKANNEGVLILAATNAPWHVDTAFRRPGRFDQVIFVPPPDAAARCAILRIHLRGKPTDNIDYDRLAAKSADFSGADLKAAIELAVEDKLRKALASGKPTPLTTADLLAAIRTQHASTKDWFATARNYVLFANVGGMWDDLRSYLESR